MRYNGLAMKNVVKKFVVGLVAVLAIGVVVLPEEKAAAQYPPPPATFCCDAYGYHRCVINPSVPGTSCFCYGQGYGYACY